MAEAGKSMVHSYHFKYIKPTEDEAFTAFVNDKEMQLKEVRLYELSTLTKKACMPLATTVDIKSFDENTLDELLKEEVFYKSLLNCKFSDFDLKKMEEIKNHISALITSRKSTEIEPHTYTSFSQLFTKN